MNAHEGRGCTPHRLLDAVAEKEAPAGAAEPDPQARSEGRSRARIGGRRQDGGGKSALTQKVDMGALLLPPAGRLGPANPLVALPNPTRSGSPQHRRARPYPLFARKRS